MKRIQIFLFLLLIICLKPLAQPAWVQIADFPGLECDDGVSFVINDKAYCGTGLQVGWSLSKDFYRLDMPTDTWTTIASLPIGEERQYASGFTDGTLGYVFGGESGGNDLNDLWTYSPTSNTWTALSSKPGNGLRGAACFVIGSTAYFAGGAYQSAAGLAEVWAYNMSSDTWTQKNNLPIGCWRGSGTSFGGKGYLLFGRELNGRFIKELYQYDPLADAWTFKSNFPNKGRSYSSLQIIGPDLVVFGGVDTLNSYYNEMWTYDLGTNNWTQQTSMPSAGRKGGMSFTSNSNYNFYYTCGIDQSDTRLKQTWKALFPDGIEEYFNRNRYTIYPNPVLDILRIAHLKSVEKFILSDVTGRIVNEGTTTGSIDVSDLSPGLYFLRLNGFSAKIIKQ
jgi:N-acetylneuraminic acid mutarotase